MAKGNKTPKYIEDDERRLIKEYFYSAEILGLKITEFFGWIEVFNGYDCFRFKVNTSGKIRLLHLSNRVLGKEKFHEQFRKYISPKDLMIYIKEHGQAKITNKWVNFTVAC